MNKTEIQKGFEKDSKNWGVKIASIMKQSAQIEQISKKAQQSAKLKILGMYYYSYYLRNPVSLKNEIPPEHRQGFYDFCAFRVTKAQTQYPIGMITVNPLPEVTFQMLDKKTRKCVKKKWIRKAEYCYECSGPNDQNLHCHIRIFTDLDKEKKKSEMEREVRNTFKMLVGNPKCVDFKWSYDMNAFKDYVRGLKSDNGILYPKEHAYYDTILRKKYGLPVVIAYPTDLS